MDSYSAFKEFLDGEDVSYNEDELRNGERVLRIPQKLKSGGNVNVVVLFGKYKIKVVILGIASVEEEDRRIACYKLFNEFNKEYAFFKMYMTPDGRICVDADFPLDLIEGDFQPKELMGFLAMGLHVCGEVYRDIMKILWF